MGLPQCQLKKWEFQAVGQESHGTKECPRPSPVALLRQARVEQAEVGGRDKSWQPGPRKGCQNSVGDKKKSS